ncbi:MAG: helix-turn-helix transcriptional regulator [Anaerolineae bacterium]|nr:helix-turn-helix transcriptional regulator [Anaerolineae bacterium]
MFDPRRMFWMKRRGWGGFRGGPFGDQEFGDGPFGKGGHGGPGRQRQRRGDIKFVLLELLKDQPRHGYELIKILEERSSGFYRPSAGVIYPTLQLLEEEGSLTSETTDGKKVYTITDAGRKLLEEQEESWGPGFGPRWGHHFKQNMPQMMEMQQAIRQLFESTMQAARYGTPEQVQAVQKVLKSAAKEVHAILAQADAESGNDKV